MAGDKTSCGEQRKLASHALHEARREPYVRRGRRALLMAILERGQATADDVRTVVELPEGIDPVCLGCVPGQLARAGIIKSAGFAKSTRPESHARPVQVWELADRQAAITWLHNHPDYSSGSELGGTASAPTPPNNEPGNTSNTHFSEVLFDA